MLKIDPITGRPEFPKHPTLEDLQGAFERTFKNRSTWINTAWCLNKVVKAFPKRQPDTIFRSEVEEFKANLLTHHTRQVVKQILSRTSSWYKWMQDCEIVPADFNPFLARVVRVYDYGPRVLRQEKT